jgi:hypothetical protein
MTYTTTTTPRTAIKNMKLATWVTDSLDNVRQDIETIKRKPLDFAMMLIAAAIVAFLMIAPFLMDNPK